MMFKKIAKGIGILIFLMVCVIVAVGIFGDDTDKKEDGKVVMTHMNQLKQQSDVVDKMLSQYEKNIFMTNTIKERIDLENQTNSILIPEIQKIGNKEVPKLKSSGSEKKQAQKLLEKATADLYFAQETRRVALVHSDSTEAIRYTKEAEQLYADYTKDCEMLAKIYNLSKK